MLTLSINKLQNQFKQSMLSVQYPWYFRNNALKMELLALGDAPYIFDVIV